MTEKERLIGRLLGKMTLKQKAGHCFTFSFSGTMLTPDIFYAIEELGCAGLRITC